MVSRQWGSCCGFGRLWARATVRREFESRGSPVVVEERTVVLDAGDIRAELMLRSVDTMHTRRGPEHWARIAGAWDGSGARISMGYLGPGLGGRDVLALRAIAVCARPVVAATRALPWARLGSAPQGKSRLARPRYCLL